MRKLYQGWLVSRSSRIEAIEEACPMGNIDEWLSGGSPAEDLTPVAEGAPLGAAVPFSIFCFVSWAGLTPLSPLGVCNLELSADNSLCSGDEGELDFLLRESPFAVLAPREELRGETRPV
jgi:hypothetical protein